MGIWRLLDAALTGTLVFGWLSLPLAWGIPPGGLARLRRGWLRGLSGILVGVLLAGAGWNLLGTDPHPWGPTCFTLRLGIASDPPVCAPRSVSWLLVGSTVALVVHHAGLWWLWSLAVRDLQPRLHRGAGLLLSAALIALLALGWVYSPADLGIGIPTPQPWYRGLTGWGIGVMGLLAGLLGALCAVSGWVWRLIHLIRRVR